jgi:hypothetical protein
MEPKGGAKLVLSRKLDNFYDRFESQVGKNKNVQI